MSVGGVEQRVQPENKDVKTPLSTDQWNEVYDNPSLGRQSGQELAQLSVEAGGDDNIFEMIFGLLFGGAVGSYHLYENIMNGREIRSDAIQRSKEQFLAITPEEKPEEEGGEVVVPGEDGEEIPIYQPEDLNLNTEAPGELSTRQEGGGLSNNQPDPNRPKRNKEFAQRNQDKWADEVVLWIAAGATAWQDVAELLSVVGELGEKISFENRVKIFIAAVEKMGGMDTTTPEQFAAAVSNAAERVRSWFGLSKELQPAVEIAVIGLLEELEIESQSAELVRPIVSQALSSPKTRSLLKSLIAHAVAFGSAPERAE